MLRYAACAWRTPCSPAVGQTLFPTAMFSFTGAPTSVLPKFTPASLLRRDVFIHSTSPSCLTSGITILSLSVIFDKSSQRALSAPFCGNASIRLSKLSLKPEVRRADGLSFSFHTSHLLHAGRRSWLLRAQQTYLCQGIYESTSTWIQYVANLGLTKHIT